MRVKKNSMDANPMGPGYRMGVIALFAVVGCSGAADQLPSTGGGGDVSLLTPCYRYSSGTSFKQPLNEFSSNGSLSLHLDFQSRVDSNGNSLYCYRADSGHQSPTLRVAPGERLSVLFSNSLSSSGGATPMSMESLGHNHASMAHASMARTAASLGSTGCGMIDMTSLSANIHFHGSHAPPSCHQDDALTTIVNPGESFQYNLAVPTSQPPGLYWYHPHSHCIAENLLLGGSSGAIVVNGIENIQPAVAGLPEQIMVFRDSRIPQSVIDAAKLNPASPALPAKDLSLNYIPITYPQYNPVVMPMKPRQMQFWRVLNASADTILNLQLQYDGVPQTIQIVALDGVPVGSKEATQRGSMIAESQVQMGPGQRAEFIVVGPSATVKNATLYTMRVDTGPAGDADVTRPLVRIVADPNAPDPEVRIPQPTAPVTPVNPADLAQMSPQATRWLYFSEQPTTPGDPKSSTSFFVTVLGQTPKLDSFYNGPSIVTNQGALEDWVVQNRSTETHVFHIHQIHFLVMARNGVSVSADEQQYRDVVEIPYWSGKVGDPYPSVQLRMNFSGNIVGTFIYHCHILEHEDKGMMAMIQVLPSGSASLDWKEIEKPFFMMSDWSRLLRTTPLWPIHFSESIESI